MTKVSYLLLLSILFFSACSDTDTAAFKKAKSDGTEYKIIAKKGGKLVTKGNILKMDIVVRYKDSLLFSTHETGMARFAPFDTTDFPPLYKEVFRTIHVGDSVVFKLSTDTLIKRGQGAPFMRKGQFIYETYKISDAYLTQAEADKELAAARVKSAEIMKAKDAEKLKTDDKTLLEYFAKNNIKAIKAPQGTYVEIVQPGTGNNADTNVVVMVNYTGKTMEGVMFDSNTDPSKRHVEPLYVNMTSDASLGMYAITGWKDGLTQLNKGAKAKFYIPSPLAYGSQPPQGSGIEPNSILVFDIEVVDILNREQAKLIADAKTAKQRSRMDSVMKARKMMAPKMDSARIKK